MKALIAIFIALVIGIGAYKIYDHWEKVKERRVLDDRAARGADIDPDQLPGMPWQLVVKLRDAQRGDAAMLKRFIDSCKNFPDVKDPRLAWVELDYVVKVSATDPLEARKIFQAVKTRTSTDSPIYPRIKSLEKNYE